MENKNAKRLGNRGLNVNGNQEIIKGKSDYFNKKFIISTSGQNELKRLLFSGNHEESIGNFKIKEIKDSNPDLSPKQILKEYEDMYCNVAQPAGWYESWTALTLSEKILIATNHLRARPQVLRADRRRTHRARRTPG